MYCIGCEFKHICVWVALFELLTPTSDGKVPGDFDSRAKMYVRVWRGGFIVETLWDQNFGAKVVFKTLENYIHCPSRRQRAAPGHHGTPRETTETSSRAQILTWQRKSTPLQKRTCCWRFVFFVFWVTQKYNLLKKL